MKKMILTVFTVFALLLSACGTEETSSSKEESNEIDIHSYTVLSVKDEISGDFDQLTHKIVRLVANDSEIDEGEMEAIAEYYIESARDISGLNSARIFFVDDEDGLVYDSEYGNTFAWIDYDNREYSYSYGHMNEQSPKFNKKDHPDEDLEIYYSFFDLYTNQEFDDIKKQDEVMQLVADEFSISVEEVDEAVSNSMLSY
ncbi:hypothetical protein [Jeotgalibacillus marinus]|uniref:Lipoprotein n=1 Tax=Jeotgalibacillus marinus TaxID=86667 RepID=A0ABV3Q4T9_9BACL